MPIKRMSEAYRTFRGLMHNPDKQSYWPGRKQKSRWMMFCDHIRWYLKYRELNHFYYCYGLDLDKGVDISQYMGKVYFNRIRSRANTRVKIAGGKTTYICLLQDKFVFGNYLKNLGLRVPKILAICDKNTLTWTDSMKRDKLEAILGLDDTDLFVKELLGGCGEGVYPIQIREGKLLMKQQEVGVDGLRDTMQDLCLIQEKIEQHSKMASLNPHSVNTIRLVTSMQEDEPVIISGICRVGVGNSGLDNWAAGGIGIGLDIEKGTLKKYGLQRPGHSIALEQHPDSNVRFEGFEIPFFKESVEAVTRVHKMFFGIHSIGWDIAIGREGPIFIEGNNNWDMPMMQIHDCHLKEKYLATIPKGIRQL